MKTFIAVLMLISSISVVSVAGATVMNFDGLESVGVGHVTHGILYSDDHEFKLYPQVIMGYGIVRTLDYNYAGRTAITIYSHDRYAAFERVDGGTFDFNSIDLSEAHKLGQYDDDEEYPGPTIARFTGYFLNGSTVESTVTLDQIFGFETFNFGNLFTDVVAMTWLQSADVGSTFYSFTEIVYNDEDKPLPTPEPSTILLLGSGLLGLGWYGRKRKKV